ncbi:MAG: hypothetical protein LBJ08_05005 [Bifidobacteriaceae bacterium]|nr:hypothetical protein [Bifidobacteriaceae bacterium]
MCLQAIGSLSSAADGVPTRVLNVTAPPPVLPTPAEAEGGKTTMAIAAIVHGPLTGIPWSCSAACQVGMAKQRP